MGWHKVDRCKVCGREVHGRRILLKENGKYVKGWGFDCYCGNKFFVPKKHG